MNKALIVDPIFRGSRLFYSWMAFEAFKNAGWSPAIYTREEYSSEDYPVYFGADAPINRVVTLPPGFWYGKLSPEQIDTIFDGLAAAVRADGAGGRRHVHFSGLDEIFPEALDALHKRAGDFPEDTTFSFVHYDARYLTNPGEGFRRVKQRIADFIATTPRARLIVLDDRARDATPAAFKDRVVFAPDPAPLSDETIAGVLAEKPAHDFYAPNDGAIRVTAIGRQSDRKGLADIVRALEGAPANVKAHVYINGTLEPSQEHYRRKLEALAARDRLTWRDAYVPEAEIRRTYRDADYILLPYDRTFEGSSGVFAYAAAFGKPLISTDHGCVGYRVRRFGLGCVYPAGRHDALGEILAGLPPPDSLAYRDMQARLKAYRQEHDLARFADCLLAAARLPPNNDARPDLTASTSAAPSPSPKEAAPASLQTRIEALNAAPRHLDYKPIVLFDTAVSSLNLGDQIIMSAVNRMLRFVFPKSLFVNVPTHEYAGAEALKLLDRAEHAFVCGTNLLSSHADDYKQWKLQGSDAYLLSGLTLLGVGWWQYQEPPNAYTQFLYSRILSKTTAHSVRDGYTKTQLARGGVPNAVNTCCPTTWMLTPRHLASIPAERQESVVFTFTDYAQNPQADSAIVQELSKRYGKVYCWLQGARDYDYAQSLGARNIEFISPSLAAYCEFLEATPCDYVGTRLHGGIRALESGRRALILAVDNRAAEISRDINLPVLKREDVAGLAQTLDAGWDLDIAVPYNEINAWIQQFGHRFGFRLEQEIDRLLYGLPYEADGGPSPWAAVIDITEAVSDGAYSHTRAVVRDLGQNEELSLLAFRYEESFGVTLRPGADASADAAIFKGLRPETDEYGPFIKVYVNPAQRKISASIDLSQNQGALLAALKHYLGFAAGDGPVRYAVNPNVSDRREARSLLATVARHFTDAFRN